MLTDAEEKILRTVARSQVISKTELKKLLQKKDMDIVVDSITKRLIDRRLISVISPVGETCFVITRKGSKFVEENLK
jgi:arginine repressor